VTTLSGVVSSAESDAPDAVRSGEQAMRLYIELARELASRLGLACPALPTNRRSAE